VPDDLSKPEPLTIYLVKESFASAQDILKDPNSSKHYPIGSGKEAIGDLYIQSRSPKQPRWARFFHKYLSPTVFGQITSANALFTIKQNRRLFALTFGTGRFLLKPDCWEDRFGLRVALNCIGEKTVKSIDKHTLDPLARHTREQASREATASEFGLDIEQDLLRAVTGTPNDPTYGKWITGMDSLHVAVPIKISRLPELLHKLYEKYLDISYQKTFPWVDQIAEIRDADLKGLLDGLLVQRLRARQKDNTWMAVPDVISWEGVGGFRFPASRGSRIEYHDVHLDHFLDSQADLSTIDENVLQTRFVECLDQEGNLLHRWKVYRCLYCELDHEGDSYLLSGGNWYRVNRDFVSRVNAAVDQIPIYDQELPTYDDQSEGDYIKRVAKANPASLAAMDGRTIAYGGGASKIEFCDLLTIKRDIVHIKRYGQAAALSHLFAQGLTSGELFQIDPDFRQSLNGKLPLGHRLTDPTKRPRQGEYQVVFAIVSDRPGPLVLPFFSRLNLKHAARRLEGYGFSVSKAKIPVSELRAKLKKIKSPKRA
jgi:uncharacterized protein (TIGR04141 family)